MSDFKKGMRYTELAYGMCISHSMNWRLAHCNESGAFFIFERFPFWKQFNNFNYYFTN